MATGEWEDVLGSKTALLRQFVRRGVGSAVGRMKPVHVHIRREGDLIASKDSQNGDNPTYVLETGSANLSLDVERTIIYMDGDLSPGLDLCLVGTREKDELLVRMAPRLSLTIDHRQTAPLVQYRVTILDVGDALGEEPLSVEQVQSLVRDKISYGGVHAHHSNYPRALQSYLRALELMNAPFPTSDEASDAVTLQMPVSKELHQPALLIWRHLSTVFNELKKYKLVCLCCDSFLERVAGPVDEVQTIRITLSKAHRMLGDVEAAAAALAPLDPSIVPVSHELRRIQKARAVQQRREKELYKRMSGGLVKRRKGALPTKGKGSDTGDGEAKLFTKDTGQGEPKAEANAKTCIGHGTAVDDRESVDGANDRSWFILHMRQLIFRNRYFLLLVSVMIIACYVWVCHDNGLFSLPFKSATTSSSAKPVSIKLPRNNMPRPS
eukprot:m.13000 g.13000  ORF g.13000 m.13000 type:complete len:438 (-) comp5890_c0_seq1:457-1770(-)